MKIYGNRSAEADRILRSSIPGNQTYTAQQIASQPMTDYTGGLAAGSCNSNGAAILQCEA